MLPSGKSKPPVAPPLFGPSLKNTTAAMQYERMIGLSSIAPIREMVLPTLTEVELRARCETLKSSSEPNACHRANVEAARQFGYWCGAPLRTCYVLVTAGVIIAVGTRGEIREKWENMEDDPLLEYTTYRPVDDAAAAREMVEQMLPLELPTIDRDIIPLDSFDQRLARIEKDMAFLKKCMSLLLDHFGIKLPIE